jgi:hypothetical protein
MQSLDQQLQNRIDKWCDILEQKSKVQTYGGQNFYFWFSHGKCYTKLVRSDKDTGENHVHAFVNKKTGDIYKPATWSAPYKERRYNIWTEFDKLLTECDWAGGYLYKK